MNDNIFLESVATFFSYEFIQVDDIQYVGGERKHVVEHLLTDLNDDEF